MPRIHRKDFSSWLRFGCWATGSSFPGMNITMKFSWWALSRAGKRSSSASFNAENHTVRRRPSSSRPRKDRLRPAHPDGEKPSGCGCDHVCPLPRARPPPFGNSPDLSPPDPGPRDNQSPAPFPKFRILGSGAYIVLPSVDFCRFPACRHHFLPLC